MIFPLVQYSLKYFQHLLIHDLAQNVFLHEGRQSGLKSEKSVEAKINVSLNKKFERSSPPCKNISRKNMVDFCLFDIIVQPLAYILIFSLFFNFYLPVNGNCIKFVRQKNACMNHGILCV